MQLFFKDPIPLQALGKCYLHDSINEVFVCRHGTRLTVSPDISAYFLAGLSGGGASILLSAVGENHCQLFVPATHAFAHMLGHQVLLRVTSQVQ